MNAVFGKLSIKDLLKGFILSVVTAILTGLLTSLDSGSLPDLLAFKAMGATALISGISYLLKNILTNSKDQFLKQEPKTEN